MSETLVKLLDDLERGALALAHEIRSTDTPVLVLEGLAAADTIRASVRRVRAERIRQDASTERAEDLFRVYAIGTLEVNPVKRTVTIGGQRLRISAKEFALLYVLASDPQRVWSKKELLAKVWGHGQYARTRTLDSHACRLRARLADVGLTMVLNTWGVGYSLIGPEASTETPRSVIAERRRREHPARRNGTKVAV